MPRYVLALLLITTTLAAQTPEHAHHHDVATEQLGAVTFPTTCVPASQPSIERGIALLHSFGYTNAQSQFEAIAASDPACAIAHWGIAMTQFQALWNQPDAAQLKRGAAEMAIARSLADKATPREKAYIAALDAFFDPVQPDYAARATAYETHMNALHQAFPDDVEAAAFDALAILAAVPPTDTSLTHERRALAILVPLFAQHPDHPGLAHYIIHTCDTPALATDGLSAAREYARIAPSSPHALHMPGHIFSRLGMWPEDIASNEASDRASRTAEAAHIPGAAHRMHADEFLIYAYLQVGQDEKARKLTLEIPSIGRHMAAMPGMDDMKDSGHFFANELAAIYAIEMHQWKTAATLTPEPNTPTEEAFHTYWAQGIAAAHLHDADLATDALANLDRSIEALQKSPYAAMFANSFAIRRDELLGWQAYTAGRPVDAVTHLRRAADQQDKLGQDEVDIPARELLGDLLMLEHHPAEALVEYRIALKLSPNRLNGLLSAAQAARQANLPTEALAYDKLAATQTHNAATSSRPQLLSAVHQAMAKP